MILFLRSPLRSFRNLSRSLSTHPRFLSQLSLLSPSAFETASICPKVSLPRAIVGMSGGVDSSVTAMFVKAKLEEEYSQVEALHMHNWDSSMEDQNPPNSLHTTQNCWEREFNDAQAVAAALGMKIKLLRLQSEYWTEVFEPFLLQLHIGITPNPDILCNQRIKFSKLLSVSPFSDSGRNPSSSDQTLIQLSVS